MTDNTDPKVERAAQQVVDKAADAIKTAAKSEKANDAEAKQEKAAKAAENAKPVAYTATADVYVDSTYYKAGEVFVTSQPKGENWTKRTAKEVAAIDASTDLVPDDANLEAADKSALQAVAIIKHVNIVGLDKQGLIDAIKAANEPKL